MREQCPAATSILSPYSTIMTESDVQLRSVPVVECAGRLIGPDVISYQSLGRQI